MGGPAWAQVRMASSGQPLSFRFLQPHDPRPLHPCLLFLGLLDLRADSVRWCLYPVPAHRGCLGPALRHLAVLRHGGCGEWGSPYTKHVDQSQARRSRGSPGALAPGPLWVRVLGSQCRWWVHRSLWSFYSALVFWRCCLIRMCH